MKKLWPVMLLVLFALASCKKDRVDGTSIRTFQESTNEMATTLNTLQQVKFNEALYIIKTFGVQAEGDLAELNAMAKLLEGKNVAEIMKIADGIAQSKGIAWSSSGPPSLGKINIFDEPTTATEKESDDVDAGKVLVQIKNIEGDSLTGVTGLRVIPRLADNTGRPIVFEEAALETTMEVSSGGSRILSRSNLMTDNNFRGFALKFSDLPASQVADGKIDITITVKTQKKKLKMTVIGQAVNGESLSVPVPKTPQNLPETEPVVPPAEGNPMNPSTAVPGAATPPPAAAKGGSPKNTVQRFLSSVNGQNLRAAYETASSSAFGSYDKFANPTSGFGNIKSVKVKNISNPVITDDKAKVQATYEVTDKNGNTSPVSASFTLKNVDGDWKIVGYSL